MPTARRASLPPVQAVTTIPGTPLSLTTRRTPLAQSTLRPDSAPPTNTALDSTARYFFSQSTANARPRAGDSKTAGGTNAATEAGIGTRDYDLVAFLRRASLLPIFDNDRTSRHPRDARLHPPHQQQPPFISARTREDSETQDRMAFKKTARTRSAAIIRLRAGGVPALGLHNRCARTQEGDQFGAEFDAKLEVEVVSIASACSITRPHNTSCNSSPSSPLSSSLLSPAILFVSRSPRFVAVL
ncbi:hypothetical protein B0H13DRAFT_2493870 [Mycena leptocephala]|nr:hypothetical protein B0H13DRAFT_2493870 [Mycena leptocephala]